MFTNLDENVNDGYGDHGNEKERRLNGYEENSDEDLEAQAEEKAIGRGHHELDRVYVFAEAVQDATDRCGLEELHACSQH
jgi:hypothetical protein